MKFVVENENAKNHIEQYWNDGDTVRVQGKLNFSVKTERHATRNPKLFVYQIDEFKCIRCGTCETNCPIKAITL